MDILNEDNFKQKLNSILKDGGVIAFVTDTVWGIGCLPSSAKGVEKIYSIKGRDTSKPLILMSNKVDFLMEYVKNVSQNAKKLIDKYFPGALTLIFERSEKTPLYMTAQMDTVGIRVPNNAVFAKLCEIVDGNVLATTSANLSNQPSAKTFEEAKAFIGEKVDLVIEDFGYVSKGLESTVAIAIGEKPKVLRQGAVKID